MALGTLAHIPEVFDLLSSRSTGDPRVFLQFLLDPNSDPEVHQLTILYGFQAFNLLAKANIRIIWAVHTVRMKSLGLAQYL